MVAYFTNEGIMVNDSLYLWNTDAKTMQEVMHNIRMSIPKNILNKIIL